MSKAGTYLSGASFIYSTTGQALALLGIVKQGSKGLQGINVPAYLDSSSLTKIKKSIKGLAPG